jgi:hypothetical protein
MRQRGIVADYLRRPSTPENQVIEELLVEIDLHIRAGNYLKAKKELNLVDQKLDLIESEVLIATFQPEEAQNSEIKLD